MSSKVDGIKGEIKSDGSMTFTCPSFSKRISDKAMLLHEQRADDSALKDRIACNRTHEKEDSMTKNGLRALRPKKKTKKPKATTLDSRKKAKRKKKRKAKKDNAKSPCKPSLEKTEECECHETLERSSAATSTALPLLTAVAKEEEAEQERGPKPSKKDTISRKKNKVNLGKKKREKKASRKKKVVGESLEEGEGVEADGGKVGGARAICLSSSRDSSTISSSSEPRQGKKTKTDPMVSSASTISVGDDCPTNEAPSQREIGQKRKPSLKTRKKSLKADDSKTKALHLQSNDKGTASGQRRYNDGAEGPRRTSIRKPKGQPNESGSAPHLRTSTKKLKRKTKKEKPEGQKKRTKIDSVSEPIDHSSLPNNESITKEEFDQGRRSFSQSISDQASVGQRTKSEEGLEHSEEDFPVYKIVAKRILGRYHHSRSSNIQNSESEPTDLESTALEFDYLLDELHLLIDTHLDVEDLLALMAVNRKHRILLQSERAFAAIWKPMFQRRWPAMAPVVCSSELEDMYNIPTAVTNSSSLSERKLNMPLLLRLGANSFPTTYDQSLLYHPEFERSTVASVNGHHGADQDEIIRYTGTIGARPYFTVRSDQPMPRPTKRTTKRRKFPFRLFTRESNDTRCHGPEELHPFVCPYRREDGSWEVTPRMFSYYEVTILPNTDLDDDEERRGCVAVGLATKSFRLDQGLMPGWDPFSFGYHGDDGGLYHPRLRNISYFDRFYIGDTVGCGVDYAKQSMFFTLNGRFLGFSWKFKDSKYLDFDLYPVVGLDTNNPIRLNFGCRDAFVFDVEGFQREQEDLIRPRYCLASPTTFV